MRSGLVLAVIVAAVLGFSLWYLLQENGHGDLREGIGKGIQALTR